MADVSTLIVRLDGHEIGTLTHVGGERTIFAFTEGYINDSDRKILSLSFKDIYGDLITDHKPSKVRLMPFFSNLLPEGHLRKYLAEKVAIHPDREFPLIRALGRDLPGAVRVEAVDGRMWSPTGPTVTDPVDSAAADSILRFSLAGVQLKFSAVGGKPGGLTIPAHGVGGDWIVKLPSTNHRGVPENEFSMMTLARMVGITVPRVDLLDVASIANLPAGIGQNGGQAFAIRRFDRTQDGGAIHIEDFAQVFGVYPEDKYKKASCANIARVIAAESDHRDVVEFIRRLTFNTLIGNGDMHLKNWSLIYPDGRNVRLSPAYDFVSTIPYIPGDRSALNYSRSRKFADFSFDELDHLAGKAALPSRLVWRAALETIALFNETWAREKNHLPMSGEVRDAIDRHLATLPVLREASAPR